MFPPLVTICNTHQCQHSCSHCFLTITRTLNTGEMAYKDFCNLIESLRGHGIFLISLSGGDPFLHPRDAVQNSRGARSRSKRDAWPACAAQPVPVAQASRQVGQAPVWARTLRGGGWRARCGVARPGKASSLALGLAPGIASRQPPPRAA